MEDKITFGLVVGNRSFFPDHLVEEGRRRIIKVIEDQGYGVVTLSPEDTKLGGVESWEDAKKCARLFREKGKLIDGIIVTLPNFGDEKAIANALRLSRLNLPVLIHAFPDALDRMDADQRRDSFCGKISVCNNLRQYGIPFTLTSLHVEEPESRIFAEDLSFFAKVCRIVNGMREGVRIGAIGARPAPFNTVRFDEKELESHGISVETVDLSEILGEVKGLGEDDARVKEGLERIRSYCDCRDVPEEALLKMARLYVVIADWIERNELDALAIQCWTALEKYYGVVPCALMSLLSESLIPSACEVDVMGALSMYVLQLASGKPSAIVDWNNNYGDEEEKAVLFHCSNFPKSLLLETKMGFQRIIASSVGQANTYGTCEGRIKPGPVTFLRITSRPESGLMAYTAEGEITDDPLETFGGWGVVRVENLQGLLRYICEEGFEHHVAINPDRSAKAVKEALGKYLGWKVHLHR